MGGVREERKGWSGVGVMEWCGSGGGEEGMEWWGRRGRDGVVGEERKGWSGGGGEEGMEWWGRRGRDGVVGEERKGWSGVGVMEWCGSDGVVWE